MASSLLTAAKPAFLFSSSSSLSSSRGSLQLSRKPSFKVSALAQKWEPSKVVPQADRVLIRLEALPEKSAGGVLLPKAAVKFERYLLGEVLSVGADVSEVESGAKVLFSDINAYEVKKLLKSYCKQKASQLISGEMRNIVSVERVNSWL